MIQSLEDYLEAIYNLASGVKGASVRAVVFLDLNLGLANKCAFFEWKIR